LFVSFILCEHFINRHEIKEPIDFIPTQFSYALFQIVSKLKNDMSKNVRIPPWYLEKMRRRERFKNALYRAALLCYPILIGFLMGLRSMGGEKKKRYRYGVLIWNSWISSAKPPYGVDVLEGDDCVNRKNTLYIVDGSVDKMNLRKLKTSGYDVCCFKEMVRRFNLFRYYRDLFPGIIKIACRMSSVHSRKALLSRSYLRVVKWHTLWEMFFSRYDIGVFISVQEPGHIIRAISQNRRGKKSVFVFTSTSYDFLHREQMNTHNDSYYGCMVHDVVISSRVANHYLKLNNNRVHQYLDHGVLNADVVFRVRTNKGLIRNIMNRLQIPQDKTVIGFFDTKSGRMAPLDNKGAFELFSSVHRLVESNEQYFMIYKSRGVRHHLRNDSIGGIVSSMINHKRVFHCEEIPFDLRPWHLMGVCDLVVGCYPTSAPLESVAGGIKSICYVSSDFYDNRVFAINAIPRFCARGYDELKACADYWLYQCTEDEFAEFQNVFVKTHIDSHSDGCATDRLRETMRNITANGIL